MLLVELCAGSSSVGRVAKDEGWDIVTVDNDPSWNPDILGDICSEEVQAKLRELKPDLCVASPPCTHFSIARTKAKLPRDVEGIGLPPVLACLKMIRAWGCMWVLETPATSLLRKQECMQGMHCQVSSHCLFGSPFQKHTACYHSGFLSLPPKCRGNCGQCVLGAKGRMVHKATAQGGPSRLSGGWAEGTALDSRQSYLMLLAKEILRQSKEWQPSAS